MLYSEKISEAFIFLSGKTDQKPKRAIILGSGLGSLAESVEDPIVVPYRDIPYCAGQQLPDMLGNWSLETLRGPTVIMQGECIIMRGIRWKKLSFP